LETSVRGPKIQVWSLDRLQELRLIRKERICSSVEVVIEELEVDIIEKIKIARQGGS